jgi:ligand-binding sensor domain-containing protein
MILPLMFATVLTVVPMAPPTVGGWTTYLKPYRYSDLLVRGDTVWCSTREAGLLRYSLSQERFAGIARFPNGLANNELSALAYDRSGRLWIGTYGSGASRMSADGQSWALVNAFDGLPSDTVNVIETEGDSVWIGTPGGIAFWNGSVIAGSLPIFGQPSPFGSDNVTGVVVHPESLWVSTPSGVYVSERATGLQFWSPLNTGLVSTDVRGLVTNDTLMFCVAQGHVYAFVNGAWHSQDPVTGVLHLFHDGPVVLASAIGGLYRLCNGGWSNVNSGVSESPGDDAGIYIPAPIGDGRYVAANQNGVMVQPTPTTASGWPTFVPDTPPDNNFHNLNIDGEAIWVTTESFGIGRLRDGAWRIWPGLPASCAGPGCDTTFLQPRAVWALLVDRQSKKWFGCWNFTLDQFDDSLSPPTVTHHLISDVFTISQHTWAWASAADSEGGRWFGMDTPLLGQVASIGLEYYDRAGNYVGNVSSPTLRGDKVHGLTVDKFGGIWFGISAKGFGHFTIPASWGPPVIEYAPGSDQLDVQGMVARGDTIWVLTTHELQRYARSPLGFPLATYTIPEATPLFAANPLAVGPDGSPWVGTEAGIRVFHSDGSSEDFNVANSPVAGNQITAIRVDPHTGVAWIATSSGLNRFDPGYRTPPPPRLPSLSVSVYPNPIALNKTGIQLRLSGNATVYDGTIVDLGGRRVRRFSGAADGSLIWDGLDEQGRRVRPGIYFVHVVAGGREATVRVAVIR